MIKNIVFDFGDVFINLDKPATIRELQKLGVEKITHEMLEIAESYEVGRISSEEFVNAFTNLHPNITGQQFIDAWNAILKDFPSHRMDFIKELHASQKYRLFLLSNTNDLHISWIQDDWQAKLYSEFKDQFEQFYLSHEINLRKPNKDIFEFVLQENGLKPKETYFIDDTKENTDAAKELGIHVWNIDPTTEDVVDLLARKEFQE
jgi:putative hydrolase of the HAD superfamily